MACHGVHTIAEYLTELGSFTMLDRAGDISCPTFIVESHGDPVGGQGKTLFDALTVERKQLYAPAKSTGVSGHCGGLGQRVWADVVYDWLDGVLADRTAAASHPASHRDRGTAMNTTTIRAVSAAPGLAGNRWLTLVAMTAHCR